MATAWPVLSRAAAKLNSNRTAAAANRKRKATGGAGDEQEQDPGQDTGAGAGAGGSGAVSRTSTGLILDLSNTDQVRQPKSIITLCCKSIPSLDSNTKIVASRFPYKIEPDVFNIRGFICANKNMMNNKSFGSS